MSQRSLAVCDCGSSDPEYQVYRCIHCGEIEVDERERAYATAEDY